MRRKCKNNAEIKYINHYTKKAIRSCKALGLTWIKNIALFHWIMTVDKCFECHNKKRFLSLWITLKIYPTNTWTALRPISAHEWKTNPNSVLEKQSLQKVFCNRSSDVIKNELHYLSPNHNFLKNPFLYLS